MSYQPLPNPLPVTGEVVADAGANLNTSGLARESGGNLATIAANTGASQSSLSALQQNGQENSQLIAVLSQILAELRLLNANFASCLPQGDNDASDFIC